MNKESMGLDCNVTIRCLDRNRQVLRESRIHNKATVLMVDGIIQFLKGHFNPSQFSEYSSEEILTRARESSSYLPTYVQFGNPGVLVEEGSVSYDPSTISHPRFTDRSLSSPLEGRDLVKISRARQSYYQDSNNSEGVVFVTYLSPGYLAGTNIYDEDAESYKFEPYSDAYKSKVLDEEGQVIREGEYEVLITEVGLISGQGGLLARVVFDGELDENKNPVDPENPRNPLRQSENTTIVIEWRVGVVSLGENDRFITQATLPNESPEVNDEEESVNELS